MTYLITAANHIYSELVSERSSIRDLAQAAATGCRTLKDLYTDRTFKDHVELLADLRRNTFPEKNFELGRAMRDLEHFHDFMEKEIMIMEKAGISNAIIDEVIDVIRQGERLRNNLYQWDNKDTELLFRDIRLIRDSTCNLSATLKLSLQRGLIAEENQKKRDIGRQVKRSFYVIIGGAVLVLNATTTSLSPSFMILSSAVGNALISQALPPA